MEGHLQGEGGLAGGGVSADDHHVPGPRMDQLVQVGKAPAQKLPGPLPAVAAKPVLQGLGHGHPADAGPVAEDQVGLVDQPPAGILILRLGQGVPYLPQPPQPGGPLQRRCVLVGVGGGGGSLHPGDQELVVTASQPLVDQDRVHAPPGAVELPEDPEDVPLGRVLEVALVHRQEHGAHGGLVDEHGPQYAHRRRHQLLRQQLPGLARFRRLAHRYRTPSPRRGCPGPGEEGGGSSSQGLALSQEAG